MALPDYTALLAAALAVYAGAAVASGRGWFPPDIRLQVPAMLLAWLFLQRPTAPQRWICGFFLWRWFRQQSHRCRCPEAAGVEAAVGRALRGEAFVWLPVTAVCVLALVACVSVEAVRKGRRGRVPVVPPCAPATERRYSERRRA